MGRSIATEYPLKKDRSPGVVAKVLNRVLQSTMTAGNGNFAANAHVTAYMAALNIITTAVNNGANVSAAAQLRQLYSNGGSGNMSPPSIVAAAAGLLPGGTSAEMDAWRLARADFRQYLTSLAHAAGVANKVAVDHLEAVLLHWNISGASLNGVNGHESPVGDRLGAGATEAARQNIALKVLPRIFPEGIPHALDSNQYSLDSII